MNKTIYCLIFASFLVFSSHAQTDSECWVTPQGSQLDGCGTEANPCGQISQCLSARTVGTSLDIILGPGEYPASGNCDTVIESSDPLTISVLNATLENPTPAILDCTNGQLVISAQSQVMKAHSYIHFSSIKFRNGLGESGGCVLFDQSSNVTLMEIHFSECAFEGCNANQEGGAVAIATSAMVSFNWCNFTANNATQGGAIANVAWLTPMTINNCLFVANTAKQGGAIWSTDVTNIYDSSFILNVATQEGGCLYHNLEGGESYFTRSVATGNTASAGGVFFLSNTVSVYGGSMNFQNCTMTKNHAVFGGAIAMDPASLQPIQMTSSGSSYVSNRALFGGFLWASTDILGFPDGITWSGNTIQNNVANMSGGGIYITTELSDNSNRDIFFPGLILSMNQPEDIFCEGKNASQVDWCTPCATMTCTDCSQYTCVEGLTTAIAPALCFSNIPKTCGANQCEFVGNQMACEVPQTSSSEHVPFSKTGGFVAMMVILFMAIFVAAVFAVIWWYRRRNTVRYTELK